MMPLPSKIASFFLIKLFSFACSSALYVDKINFAPFLRHFALRYNNIVINELSPASQEYQTKKKLVPDNKITPRFDFTTFIPLRYTAMINNLRFLVRVRFDIFSISFSSGAVEKTET